MKILSTLLVFLSLFLSLVAEEPSALDKELDGLDKKIHALRLKIMDSEVKSQSYIKYEWKDYAHEIEEAEIDEKKLKLLEDQYQKLLKQKESMSNGRQHVGS